MTPRIFTLICIQFFSLLLSASSPVPFWSDTFSNGLSASWSVGDELSTGNDAVYWDYCNDFKNCPPTTFMQINVFTDERFESSSVENGYIYVKPFGEGSSSADHSSYIQTPSIDCSSQQQVFLNFTTIILASQSNPETAAVIQVRNGPAGDWIDFEVFHALNTDDVEPGIFGLQSYNAQKICIDISSVAAGSDEVYIRWVWNYNGNDEFFWAVDDVALHSENPLYEMAVWGHLPGQGGFPGGLNGWTTETNGDCGFEWDQTALVDIPDQDPRADYYGCSCTAPNGVAVVNASWCFPEITNAELISPMIDLSTTAAGKRLALRFHQTGSLGNPPSADEPLTYVLVSVDNGQNYSDTIGLNRQKPFQQVFCETRTVSLPEIVNGSSQVRLKFVFNGQVTFWMLDDVTIVERYDNDLALREGGYSVAPNYMTPGLLVRPFGFAVETENVGNLSQQGISVSIVVKNDETGEVVHTDTVAIGELGSGMVYSDAEFTENFLPPANEATYTAVYRIHGNTADEDTLNNSIRWKFEVTDDLYSKTKRENAINGAFAPFDEITYEIGNCYFIPAGSEVQATHLSFAFANANALFGTTLRTNLYKWKSDGSWGDSNMDTLANSPEFELVAFNIYQVTGDEGLRDVITIPVDFESDGHVLEDSTYYFITVEYNDPVTGPGGQPVPFFIAASEEIDYTNTFVQSFQTGPPVYYSMLRLGSDDFFRANSWGLRRIPYVQLHVSEVTATADQQVTPLALSLFPNPASDRIFISTGITGLQRNVSVEIIDICGRLVEVRHFENAFVSQLPIDLNNLSNGSYILHLFTGEKRGAAIFAVHRN